MTRRWQLVGILGTLLIAGLLIWNLVENDLLRGEPRPLWAYILIGVGLIAVVQLMVALPWYYFGVISHDAGYAYTEVVKQDRKRAYAASHRLARKVERLRGSTE